MIQTFFQVVFPVLLVLSLGLIIGKVFHPETKTLSTLSIYLLTPALIFQSVYLYHDLFTVTTLKMFGVITLITLLVILSLDLISRVIPMKHSVKVALTLTLMLSNSGNFGLPVNQYAYGEQALYIASVILVIYSLYTNTLGVFVAASDRNGRRESVKKMLTVPFFYVLVIAMALNYFHVTIPAPIFKPIQSVGLAAIPLNLLQLGINLSSIKIKEQWSLMLGASVIKLALIPFGAFFLLKLLGFTGLEFKVTLTQIAMPSAVYASILASHFESDESLTSGIVLVSTLLSLISLSIWISILK